MKEAIGRMKEIAYLAKKHEWDEDVTVKIQLHHVFAVLDFYERHKDENEPSLKPKEEAESDANAAFIAAAPEMLELLKELCQLVKESARIYDNPFEGDDKIFESIKKSQLVINKAESK